jgi:hypothetical protein
MFDARHAVADNVIEAAAASARIFRTFLLIMALFLLWFVVLMAIR